MNPSHQQQKSDISVVQLAEALIQGDVLIALQERGEAAPAWGYLNLLAHSDRNSFDGCVTSTSPAGLCRAGALWCST